ncbi:aminotransferase [Scleroderma yunnanense]
MEAPFSLLATLRFDPFLETMGWNNDPDGLPSPYLLLSHQLERLVASSLALQWRSAQDLTFAKLKNVCDTIVQDVNGVDPGQPLRIRLVLSPVDLTASASPLQSLQHDPTLPSLFNPLSDSQVLFEPILRICVDSQPTSNTVSMKTTNRRPYDDARIRTGVPPVGAPRGVASDCPDDVILYNTRETVTETSIHNIAFFRHGRWITPPLTAGCISGAFRRWLLENNRIHEVPENEVSLKAIVSNEWVLVFNGVTGCRLGRVWLRE